MERESTILVSGVVERGLGVCGGGLTIMLYTIQFLVLPNKPKHKHNELCHGTG
jgi:hypothetical protein